MQGEFGWRYALRLLGALGVVALVCTVGLTYAPKIVEAVKRFGEPMRKAWVQAAGPFALRIQEADAAARAKNHGRAIELYSSVLADAAVTNDDRRIILPRRAIALEWALRHAEAEADWTAALALDPADADLHYKRGLFYQRRKRHDEALADFTAGKRLKPTDPLLSLSEGGAHWDRREYRLAIDAYSEAIRLKPDLMRAYLGRASAYSHEKMYREARADYDHLIADLERKGPATKSLSVRDIALAYYGRGHANAQLKDYGRAKDDLDKSLAEQPKSGAALKWRGYALERMGDKELALADYRAALALMQEDKWLSDRIRLLEAR